MLGHLRRAPLRRFAERAPPLLPQSSPLATSSCHHRRLFDLQLLPADNHRYFSGVPNNNDNVDDGPFNRHAKKMQRARAAESSRLHARTVRKRQRQIIDGNNHVEGDNNGNVQEEEDEPLPYDYFHREVANRLIERLDDICHHEDGFPLALEVGAGAGFVRDAINEGLDDEDAPLGFEEEGVGSDVAAGGVGRGGVRKLVQLDSCRTVLHRDDDDDHDDGETAEGGAKGCETYKIVADEEDPLPFPDETFDLVVSSMALHRINDLPGLLLEIKRVLKPDGCLLFALPGGSTLPELRSSLVLAELERSGGVSTHVGPFVELSHAGSLLTETGFKLPTIDVDEIRVGYPNGVAVMEHLGRMGEGNACVHRRERVELGVFLAGACLYRELYPLEEDGGKDGGDGGGGEVVASVQVIYGIAWKEHESQQQPKDRGSATRSMTDVSVTQTAAGVEEGRKEP